MVQNARVRFFLGTGAGFATFALVWIALPSALSIYLRQVFPKGSLGLSMYYVSVAVAPYLAIRAAGYVAKGGSAGAIVVVWFLTFVVSGAGVLNGFASDGHPGDPGLAISSGIALMAGIIGALQEVVNLAPKARLHPEEEADVEPS